MTIVVHIIDDDDAVRDSMRALLESYDYEVCDHPDAKSYLGHSGKGSRCLLVDHHMPVMTGLELIEHLRTQGDQTPALMMTGRGDPTIAARAAQFGVKVLNKPVGENQLVEWIEQVRRGPAGK